MRIGDYNINLKNASKNKRQYWNEVKRLYNEFSSQGIKLDVHQITENFITNKGRVTKELLDLLSQTGKDREYKFQQINNMLYKITKRETIDPETGEILDDKEQYYRIEFRNFMNLLPLHPNTTTRRGRQRRLTKGEKEGIALGNTLARIADTRGYKVAVAAINSIPADIRNKITNADAAIRYDAFGDILAFIETIDLDSLNEADFYHHNDAQSYNEDYEDYEDYE